MAHSKKRSGSETRKRHSPLGFRATPEERAEIEAAADRVGLTVSSYVRSRSLSKPTTRAVRRPLAEAAQLAQILGLLGKAGGTLQQIASNAQNAPGDAQVAIAEFRAAAAAIMRALGKRTHDH